MRQKYPRSYHLPWSPGATSDDKRVKSVAHFEGQQVVVTEKLDGGCTTIYPDGFVHARSLDGLRHPSQDWVRALAGEIGHNIPETFRVCGEDVYAKHSIHYTHLKTYFYVFAIFDGDLSLPWSEVESYCEMLGLQTVPVLYRGVWDEPAVNACYKGTSAFGDTQEGYVVRLARSFTMAEYPTALAKYVRVNHVTTDKHWRSGPLQPNLIAP